MKFFITLLLLGISCLPVCSQVKILFDASKAETAGNADWVIDADLHNLIYNSNGTVSTGGSNNQSNAQRIPSPAQSGIIASTPETYWDGALSNWGTDCVKRGYQVESLPYNGIISYGNSSNPQDLSNYKVFIVCEPNIVFTISEKQAILSFVQNGGGLFMVSDHTISDRNNDGWDSPAIWDDLMTNNGVINNPFGLSFDLADFSETSSNISSATDSLINGPMGVVSQIKWSGGTSVTISPAANSSVKGVVYKTGSSFGNTNVMVARARYGNGKVVAFGDSSPCDDGTGDPNDNLFNGYTGDVGVNHQRILMNATIWLATNVITGINDLPSQTFDVKVFPDPSKDISTVTYTLRSTSNIILRILDMSGRAIQSVERKNQTPGDHAEIINVSLLPAGIYFIELKTKTQAILKKLVIQ